MTNIIETNFNAERVREVLAQKPCVEWGPKDISRIPLQVILPYENIIKGYLIKPDSDAPDTDTVLHMSTYWVNTFMRRNGIGTKLLKVFTSEGIREGATTLHGLVWSEGALRTRAKVFGENNLVFSKSRYMEDKLDLTFEEAVADGHYPVHVFSDLTKVNIRDLE